MGDVGGGSLINPYGVATSQIVGESAFAISPCTIKSGRFLLVLAQLSGPRKRFCVCRPLQAS